MIVSAAVCPSPPLLARELTGRADVLPELKDACAAAVRHLLDATPDVIAVVGAGPDTATWDPDDRLDLSAYASVPRRATRPPSAGPVPAAPAPHGATRPPAAAPVPAAPALPRATRPPLAGSGPMPPARVQATSSHASSAAGGPAPAHRGKPGLPLALGIGALLLDEAGYTGPLILQAVDESAPPGDCLRLGRDVAAAAPRVALLAVGDGSTRRGPAAPGHLDERAVPFDDAVRRALRDGDMAALGRLDPDLARDLMATGRAAWQVLAGAFAGARPATEIRYAEDPFGVAYLVATLA